MTLKIVPLAWQFALQRDGKQISVHDSEEAANAAKKLAAEKGVQVPDDAVK